MNTLTNLDNFTQEFPLDPSLIYLNHAAVSPFEDIAKVTHHPNSTVAEVIVKVS